LYFIVLCDDDDDSDDDDDDDDDDGDDDKVTIMYSFISSLSRLGARESPTTVLVIVLCV